MRMSRNDKDFIVKVVICMMKICLPLEGARHWTDMLRIRCFLTLLRFLLNRLCKKR